MADLTEAEAKAKADADAAKAKADADTAKAVERARAAQEAVEARLLVSMTKEGETLRVHPTCVDAHKLAGWKLAA